METMRVAPPLDENSNSAETKNLQVGDQKSLKASVSLEDSPKVSELSRSDEGGCTTTGADADCSNQEEYSSNEEEYSSNEDDDSSSSCSEDEIVPISGSTEHLFLLSAHPEIYRGLPDSELRAVQHKLNSIATPQLVCRKCSMELPIDEQDRIVRHVGECWSSLENPQKESFKSAYSEVEAFVDAMLGIPNFEFEDPESNFDLEKCNMKKDRLLFLCETEGSAEIGLTAYLLSYGMEGTVGDFTNSPSAMAYLCENLEFKDENLQHSTKLKDLRSGKLTCQAGGHLAWKVTGLGSISLLSDPAWPVWDCHVLMDRFAWKVCSGCEQGYGRYYSKQTPVPPGELLKGMEVLFNPATFCSAQCQIAFNKKTQNKSCPDCCSLFPVSSSWQCSCIKDFRLEMSESSSCSSESSSNSSCSDEDCSVCCSADTSGNLGDKSTSSKGSVCSCLHCQASECNDTGCSVCLETSTSSANTSSTSSTSENTLAD